MSRPPKRRRLTPQRKKALSYARDHRSDYGQNDKATRRLVPKRKAQEHRATRRVDKAAIRHDPASTTSAPKRGWWRKAPDLPLGADLERPRFSDNRHRKDEPYDKSRLEPPHEAVRRRVLRRVRQVLKDQA